MSGSETISRSGVPVRLRSIWLSARLWPWSLVMDAFAGIVFEVGAGDADPFGLETFFFFVADF